MSNLLNQFQELNTSTYTYEDVMYLSDWAIDAYDEIKRLTEELRITKEIADYYTGIVEHEERLRIERAR